MSVPSYTNIVLCGMPSCGKTTIGGILAARLSRVFVDTDSLVVERCRRSIREIFETEGETGFRAREKEVIREISGCSGLVIATGGGSVLDSDNVVALKKNGIIIFIDRDPQNLQPGDDRPLFKSASDAVALYQARAKAYHDAADLILSNNACIEDAVANLLSLLQQ